MYHFSRVFVSVSVRYSHIISENIEGFHGVMAALFNTFTFLHNPWTAQLAATFA